TLIVSAAATATAGANATVTFSAGSQVVLLSATVTSAVATVNAGSVTFTVLNNGVAIGSAVTVNVVNGAATTNYALPARTPGGTLPPQHRLRGHEHLPRFPRPQPLPDHQRRRHGHGGGQRLHGLQRRRPNRDAQFHGDEHRRRRQPGDGDVYPAQ